MTSYEEIDPLVALGEKPREIQTELVELEEVSPRCYALKLRTWGAAPGVEG